MSASIIGKVIAKNSHKNYDVKWNSSSKEVYVSYQSWTLIGKASSAGEAMTKAEAWLYNK